MVLDFINKFLAYEENEVLLKTFTSGFCYYFAIILRERFGGEVVYDPIEGHFLLLLEGLLYDITGEATAKHKVYYCPLEWKAEKSIVNGCILKVD